MDAKIRTPESPAADSFRPVVLAPTFNNFRTLESILDRIVATGYPLIVVNDGSTDGTASLLDKRAASISEEVLIVSTHAINRGKANALRTGFAAADERGFTHVVTIDTDGQLDPEQIPDLIAIAREHPQALVVGTRDENAEDYPARSRIGRRLSNAMVRLECGVRVDDSQCGFRVYPIGLVNTVRVTAEFFGFETEIITRAGWANCPSVNFPVRCRYLPPGERVSHFRPYVDTVRGLLMHVRLTALALLPLRHTQWPIHHRITCREQLRDWRARSLWAWFSPSSAWQQLREDGVGQTHFAAGLATGVFIANLPLYGLQTVLGLYAAKRLHLHPLSVVAGSQISTPPVGPILVAIAVALGHLLLHGSIPNPSDFNIRSRGVGPVVGPLLLEWTVGSIIVGFLSAITAFILFRWMLGWVEKRGGA